MQVKFLLKIKNSDLCMNSIPFTLLSRYLFPLAFLSLNCLLMLNAYVYFILLKDVEKFICRKDELWEAIIHHLVVILGKQLCLFKKVESKPLVISNY